MLVVSRHGLHHMKTQVIYSRDEEAYALIRKEGKSGTHKPRSKTVLKVEIVYENLSFLLLLLSCTKFSLFQSRQGYT